MQACFRDGLSVAKLDWTEAERCELVVPNTGVFSSCHFSLVADFILRGVIPSFALDG